MNKMNDTSLQTLILHLQRKKNKEGKKNNSRFKITSTY